MAEALRWYRINPTMLLDGTDNPLGTEIHGTVAWVLLVVPDCWHCPSASSEPPSTPSAPTPRDTADPPPAPVGTPSKLRAEALAEFLAAWETEHGTLTVDEIARAEAELGLRASDAA